MFVTKQIWATYHLPVEARKFGSIDACSAFPFKKLKTWDLKTNKKNVPGYVCNPGSPRERDAASKR